MKERERKREKVCVRERERKRAKIRGKEGKEQFARVRAALEERDALHCEIAYFACESRSFERDMAGRKIKSFLYIRIVPIPLSHREKDMFVVHCSGLLEKKKQTM